MKKNVQIIKLVSGEELLTKIKFGKGKKNDILIDPCIITHLENGEITFGPYAPYSKDMQLFNSPIIWQANPDIELIEKYLEVVDKLQYETQLPE